ncbi:dihydrofolate reductase [Psychrobacillus phage Perkons]|nr:dihydrofolate reductase [Psychrobacillus phage Perkons]
MTINLICAIDKNGGIGYKNELLARIHNDLKRFKELTIGESDGGNFILMGRNTYESLPSNLPNRSNIIVSRNHKYKQPVGTFLYQSIADVITEYKNYNEENGDLWVAGGQSVYEQTLKYADRIYLTIIHHEFQNVDSHFPTFNLDEWNVIELSEDYTDEESGLEYHFITYERIKL